MTIGPSLNLLPELKKKVLKCKGHERKEEEIYKKKTK
jgi:hypothetical protein